MEFLNERLAQIIIDKLEPAIPYKINIMNDEGVIIASSDISRINIIHEGAKTAIILKQTVEIHEAQNNQKPGINIPMQFHGEIIGTIGITGEPDEVRRYGEIVKIMAELLINEQSRIEEKNNLSADIESFLARIARIEDNYTQELIDYGKSIGVELDVIKQALVIICNIDNVSKVKNILINLLDSNEFVLKYTFSKLILFLKEKSKVTLLLKAIEKENLVIGFGTKQNIISKSIKEAERAIKIGTIVSYKEKQFHFERFNYLNMLINDCNNKLLESIYFKISDPKHEDLILTIETFVTENCAINTTAKILHIHRNTLKYRLDKIYLLAGKNPYNSIELMELYASVFLNKWNTRQC